MLMGDVIAAPSVGSIANGVLMLVPEQIIINDFCDHKDPPVAFLWDKPRAPNSSYSP
jgi:hypothetical protein